jgi:N-acetylglucosaminyldiphosphoundecaprenol N-acetyl-beta-D-mannosaminyltransferase
MGTALKPNPAKPNQAFCQILGLNFFTGNASEAVDRMSHGGLLVVPSAPVLKDLRTNLKYREAALNADLLIADSSFMVLIWNSIDRDRIKRVSGLAYLRELLSRPDVREPGATFWIMASPESARRNTRWLHSRGFSLKPDDVYIAPLYTGDIADPELLARLSERRPRHIVVTIGGGTQEGLGLYIKRNVDFAPAIHCIGAAIAFLSGDQVQIPEWADHFYLGWLLRCLANPRRYIARYWAARKLLPLMVRYRRELPSPEL